MKWIMDYSPSSFCKDFFRGARGGAGPVGEGGKGGSRARGRGWQGGEKGPWERVARGGGVRLFLF